MVDAGRRFLFLINKIENNTIHITEILQNKSTDAATAASNLGGLSESRGIACDSSSIGSIGNSYIEPGNMSFLANDTFASIYDSSGAAKYIVVVVLVYGFAIIFFIGSQVRSTKKFSDEVDSVNAEKILRSMETEIFTKEVLEKLSDKEHRERAWKIYLSKPTTPSPSGMSPSSSRRNSAVGSINQKSQNKGAIYDDASLKKIDKTAVSSIEKKLKLLNKANNREVEIETIKEVQRINKRKYSTNSAVNVAKYSDLLKNSFKLKNSLQDHNSPNMIKSQPPLIVLQTDQEGLEKLKKFNSKQPKNNLNFDKERSRTISGSKFSSIAALNVNPDDYEQSCSYSSHSFINFDACEISEKITSV